jgi:hypothetical protein
MQVAAIATLQVGRPHDLPGLVPVPFVALQDLPGLVPVPFVALQDLPGLVPVPFVAFREIQAIKALQSGWALQKRSAQIAAGCIVPHSQQGG